MACTKWDIIDPRCQLKQVAQSAFDSLARSFASAASDASNWMWKQIDQATTVNLSSAGINKDLLATGAIALVLCTALFVIQVITAVLRREPGGLARAVRGLGVATMMSAFAILTTKILLSVVDQLSDGVVRFSTGEGIDGLGTRFAIATSLSQMVNPAALLLFAVVVLVAVVIVWAAMMIRKLLIIVAAVMTPIAFAGGAADITRSWVRRWVEFTAALIASKLLLVVMLMVGLSVFEGAGMQTSPDGQLATTGTQAGTQLACGTVLLLMAGFAPWIAIRMFHFAGDSLHAVHTQAISAGAGTQTVVAAPRKVSTTMAVGRSFTASSASIGPRATGGPPVDAQAPRATTPQVNGASDPAMPTAHRAAELPGDRAMPGSSTPSAAGATEPPAARDVRATASESRQPTTQTPTRDI